MHESDTIAAIATAPGRGGVAVVRVSGPSAFGIATRLVRHPVTGDVAGRFSHVTFSHPRTDTVLDDGLLLVFRAPNSYTGEDIVEFQTHGGSVVPRRVLEAALSAGARLAHRGEFTLRAFLNGRLDLTEAEAVIDLVDARTDRAADDAVARLGGALSAPFGKLYGEALAVSAEIEHSLDFDEGELPPDFAVGLVRRTDVLARAVSAAAATAREGRILREGALVVIAGRPNAGKSSLLNALLGADRAIVSPEAGTTRDSIEELFDLDGWPVRLVDTAGLRAGVRGVEAEGVARAEKLVREADVILEVIDGAAPSVPAFAADARTLVAVSKADLSGGRRAAAGLGFSSKTGVGLVELRAALVRKIAALAAHGEEASGADVTTRQRELLGTAAAALERARAALAAPEFVVAADEFRTAADALGRLVGKVYSDDLLDSIFSRFCVGK